MRGSMILVTAVMSTAACTGGDATRDSAVQNAVPDLSDSQTVEAGQRATCALLMDGEIYCWGTTTWGATLFPPGQFSQLSFGENFACAQDSNSALSCWGYRYSDPSDGIDPPPADSFRSFRVGSEHACGIRDSDGRLICWGYSSDAWENPPEMDFSVVAPGSGETCALDTEGIVHCWGRNPDSLVVTDSPPGIFIDVVAAFYVACALRADGTASCWGPDSDPQSTPEGPFQSIFAGPAYICGILVSGQATCWGRFSPGEPPTGAYTHLSGGTTHACGQLEGGELACWGDDSDGQSSIP